MVTGWHSSGIGLAFVPYVNIHYSPSKMEFNGRFNWLTWKKKTKHEPFFTHQRTFGFLPRRFFIQKFPRFPALKISWAYQFCKLFTSLKFVFRISFCLKLSHFIQSVDYPLKRKSSFQPVPLSHMIVQNVIAWVHIPTFLKQVQTHRMPGTADRSHCHHTHSHYLDHSFYNIIHSLPDLENSLNSHKIQFAPI